MQRIWEGLVEPSPALADVGDRSRARVLASFLVVLVPLGWLAGVVQLAVVPNFLGRFAAMGAALVVLSVSYGLRDRKSTRLNSSH